MHHPTPETLQSFALGRLDHESSSSVQAHLDQCKICRDFATHLKVVQPLDPFANASIESVAKSPLPPRAPKESWSLDETAPLPLPKAPKAKRSPTRRSEIDQRIVETATARRIEIRDSPRIPDWILPLATLGIASAISTVLAIGYMVLQPTIDNRMNNARNNASVKVGILHSLTGTMAISESSLKDVELMAIEEINRTGGVLGKQIEAIVEDPGSDFTVRFPERAKKLLQRDKVACVFGCWTSVSRKNVLPVFEENKGLLFYPVAYEGNECSNSVVYSGAAPNQQILPAVEWLMTKQGGGHKNFYLIGTDYVFPRTANLVIVKYLERNGGKVVAEEYAPFGHRDYRTLVETIKTSGADVVFSTINGDSNINFYNEMAAQGLTAEKMPVVAASIGEDELRGLDPSKVKGHLAAWNYFQSIDTPRNREFVKRFQDKYGKDRVTDDPVAAAYAQVYLWKAAVEKARSFAVKDVQDALHSGGVEFDAPEGRISVDKHNNHVKKAFYMGKIRDDKQFDIVYKTEPIDPEPYPQIVFPGWHCDWTKGPPVRGAPFDFFRKK
jgi:urea transport system substrate-binding protein